MNDRNRNVYDIYLIMRSVTAAQRGKTELERSRIPVRLQRSPGGLSDNGCAYALRIRPLDLPRAVPILSRIELEPIRVYRELADGGFERIRL